MLHPRTGLMLTDAGASGQRSVQPVEANFFDFDPAIAHRLKAALLEYLAMALAVEQGKAAVARTWGEQRNEKTHGGLPFGWLPTKLTASRDTQVNGG